MLHHSCHGDHVHVSARKDGDDLLIEHAQVLERGNSEQARVLDDHLVVLDHIEEGNDQFVVVDRDDLVDVLLDVGKHLVARFEHGGAIGDGAH